MDIGANMGIYTILASKYVEKVIAFEPTKKNAALINLSLVNSNSENCLIYQNIVSNQDDKIQFLEVSESGLSRAITTNSDTVMKQINDEYGKLETNIDEYKCITIDSLNLDRIDIMKIDVEGFELKVIDGAIETLKRCRPRLIMIEVVESAMVLNGDKPKDLVVVLNKLGYSPKILSKGRLVEYVDQKIPRDNLFFSL
ncbi:FkbM family methyltransferase [Alphaproteobacteria bacterium]|nr:FkbM family methyltransferase [Alphaproteobacteria bacterium]